MSRRTSQHSAPDFSGAAPLTGAAADPELARKGGSVTAAESRAKAAALRRAQQAAKSRWLKREKIPLQWTLDAMHKWYLSQRPKK